MDSHLVTAFVLLLSSWNLLLAQPPEQGRNGSDFDQGFDQNASLDQGDALKRLFEEKQNDSGDLQGHSVFCGESAMKIVLPEGSHEVNVIGPARDDPVLQCLEACGCFMVEENRENILVVSYSGCHVIAEGGKYTLRVLYRDGTEQTDVAVVSCAANPTEMASSIPHCISQGLCSYNPVSKEAVVPSTHRDSVHWMPPAPEMPRNVFGTHLGPVPWLPLAPENTRDVTGKPLDSVPWMPFSYVPWMPLSYVPWTPLAPEKPIHIPGMRRGSVSRTAIAQEKLGDIPNKTKATKSPRDVPGKPLGSVPWMPLGSVPWSPRATEKSTHIPGMWRGSVSSTAVAQKKLGDVPDTTLTRKAPRGVPGKSLGSVPWRSFVPEKLGDVPDRTLAPGPPRDVPGNILGSVPWMPFVPEKLRDVTGMTLTPGSPRGVPGKLSGYVPWMPFVPEKLGDVPDRTLVPGSPRDVPGKLLGSVPWMPFVPEKLRDIPDRTLAPGSPREFSGKLLGFDPWMTLSPESPSDVLDTTLAPETSLGAVPGAPRPPPAAMMTFLASRAQRHMYKQGGCSVPTSQRLPCLPGAPAARCLNKGCCVDSSSSTCYYPMNECTADGHFVFAVPADIASNPVDLAGLTVAGNDACSPVIVNEDAAVFKFRLTECGTHSYQIGLTTIYFAEVQSALRTLNLKYGIITRDEFFRLIVECRYSNFSSLDVEGRVFASSGYMVMNPSLPALVRAKGLYGVQLRIAEDKTFSKFLPHYHQPLRKLLGKPVYLEVRLKSPKPDATLLVHYCVAYPRSASSALVLLYDGCPNPFDSDVLILHRADAPQSRHKRRFEVKAFEFVNQSSNNLLNEEIYFMCSTEVCMPSKSPCKETCLEES